MREKVLRYIREQKLIAPGDRVLVAVSGGADSVALLRILMELRPDLGIVLGAAHFHHGLRGEAADADEHFVKELAARLELEFFAGRGNIPAHAEATNTSLEAAGRHQRYDWLATVATGNRYDAVATAHTSDDQAETVLMKFLRGAGTRGLAGIYPEVLNPYRHTVRFVRPLLSTSRVEVEAYLNCLHQEWREDESNLDHRFRRNRVRHQLLPLLQREYAANIREGLSDTAEIARADEAYWDTTLEPLLTERHPAPGRLQLTGFADLHLATQRRLLKRFVELEGGAANFRHLERMRRCALGEIESCELPGGWTVVVEDSHLCIARPRPLHPVQGYALQLSIPGEVTLPESGRVIRAVPVREAFAGEAEPGSLLSADLVGPMLTIRNWLPGDRYRPAHRAAEEKLKRLFSERKILAEDRPQWPVALKGGEIVWVQGFAVAQSYCWSGAGDGVRIEVVPA